jgi:polysaccharide biosynthesis protein PslH
MNILYLVHRLPFPPNKGDKVRSYHLLRALAAKHRVFVGTFVDDAEDEVRRDKVCALCTELFAPRLHRGWARVASLRGLLNREALTLSYYRQGRLSRWVKEVMRREPIDAIVVFSSSMTQYAMNQSAPVLVDFVDVDSAKWEDYAAQHGWPMSWLYAREARKLLEVEKSASDAAAASFFVTQREAELFRRRAGGHAQRVETIGNGVDTDYFDPEVVRASPFDADEVPVVFTGAMDYLPNVDAMVWFQSRVLPELRKAWPAVRLHVVGRRPNRTVRSLAGAAVHVTGAVPDVRPYLQHAAVVVAPMRLARGIHNKVLEAMAMACPLVASAPCVASLEVTVGTDLLSADGPEDFARQVGALIGDPQRARQLGRAARETMRRSYQWATRLAPLDRRLESIAAEGQAA